MNILTIQGGLGNQMFQYAFACAMQHKKPWRLWLYDYRYCNDHQGFELTRIFPVRKWYIDATNRIIGSRIRKHMDRFISTIEDVSPYTKWLEEPKNWIRYTGYWQTEAYFKEVENVIRKKFAFRETLLNEQSRQLARNLTNAGGYISLHVRRGDYLQIDNGENVLKVLYYQRAIEIMNEKVKNPTYVVFSDDINWCRESLPIKDALFVDWNKGKDSWQDMYLMSMCDHNIIANSSFSWWGAWLNQHVDKIVVAPKMGGDIIPQTWIQLDRDGVEIK